MGKRSGQWARIAQRVLLTGETPSQALRQLAADDGPLIPVAVDGQRELEASLLRALDTTARVLRSAPVIRSVRPAADELRLEVEETALDRFLAVVLPVVGPDGLSGIPGLRPDPGRRHLDLRVVGRRGRVRLLGVDRARWRAAARTRDGTVWRDCRGGLHDAERSASRDQAAEPTALMSAVLRRFLLWRRASDVAVGVSTRMVRVAWRDGPSEVAAAGVLSRSTCRIPGLFTRSPGRHAWLRCLVLGVR